MEQDKKPAPVSFRGSCLGIGLMVVMVIGLVAWIALIVAGYLHVGR